MAGRQFPEAEDSGAEPAEEEEGEEASEPEEEEEEAESTSPCPSNSVSTITSRTVVTSTKGCTSA